MTKVTRHERIKFAIAKTSGVVVWVKPSDYTSIVVLRNAIYLDMCAALRSLRAIRDAAIRWRNGDTGDCLELDRALDAYDAEEDG
jgi:hypothetical protein